MNKNKINIATAILSVFFLFTVMSCNEPIDRKNDKPINENENENDDDDDDDNKKKEPLPLPGNVIILQAFGTGNNTDGGVSHSFIELYNKSNEEADLSGCFLHYCEGGADWKTLDLDGKIIPAHSSFLILGIKKNNLNQTAGTGLLQLTENTADMIWDLQMSNKLFKIFLTENGEPLTAVNPFDSHGDRTGVKAEGYIDLLGTNDNDKSVNIDAYETGALTDTSVRAPYLLSKGKSARRTSLDDTDDNNADFNSIEWRKRPGDTKILSDEEFEAFRPRSVSGGSWDPFYLKTPEANDADIRVLKIAGKLTGAGTPASSFQDVTNPGAITITNMITNVPVEITAAEGAVYRTAKADGESEPQWKDELSPDYSFTNGDFLYIEVTSRNKIKVNVYKIEVTVTQITEAVTVRGTCNLQINSGLSQQKIVVEAFESSAAAEPVSRVNADIQEKTWTLIVPASQPVWFKVTVTDSSGYTFGKIVSQSAQLFTSDTTGVALTLGPFALPEIKTFTLINADAYDGTRRNKDASINQANGEITFAATSFTTISRGNGHDTILDFHKLTADFTLSQDSRLYAGNTEQVSGVTANNYYSDVNFTVIAEDNTRKSYKVSGPASGSNRVVNTMSWQTQGFGILKITTTDKTLGMPIMVPVNSTISPQTPKLNMIWNTTGSYTYISPEGRVVEGGTDIRGRGNWSLRRHGNKSYNLKLNTAVSFDYYDYKEQKYLQMPAHRRWALLAHEGDSSRIKTTLGFEMGRRVLTNMGWQPRSDWVFLFLNGDYKGVYILAEVIKPESGRMNIEPVASKSNPAGGFIAELNNICWYTNDIHRSVNTEGNEFIFDEMYTFMTSHMNQVENPSESNGGTNQWKQQGVAFSFKEPDSNLGWYYNDPPEGSGNLTYSDTTHFPRKGIALFARIATGSAASKPPGQWTVPNDFGQPNGMGTAGMIKNGGIYGDRTLDQIFPDYESSAFVKISKFIQDAEDAVYAHRFSGADSYRNYIDIDAFIDWQIAQEIANNWEVSTMNGQYMHYDPSAKKLKMGPMWDLDNGWDEWDRKGQVRNSPFWIKEMMNDPVYTARLKTRWNEVRSKFSTELNPYIDATNTRFARITSYSNQPNWLGGNRSDLKNVLSTQVNRIHTLINGY